MLVAEGDEMLMRIGETVSARRDALRSRSCGRRRTGGTEPLGVVNLSDRYSNQPFTAGDQKLIAAIATQIGTAIQNTRLVRARSSSSGSIQELALAHDLQMKLLPNARVVAPRGAGRGARRARGERRRRFLQSLSTLAAIAPA